MSRSLHTKPGSDRALGPGIGAGAGALRRRRRRPAGLPPELSVYAPASLSLEESTGLGPDEALLRPAPAPPPPPEETGETTAPLSREELLAESISLVLQEESTAVEVVEPRAPRPEATVDEETEMVPRDDVQAPLLRLGDLRLPELSPMALPTQVLPGDWPVPSGGRAPSGTVSAAVLDDVQEEPAPEELELLREDESVGDEDSVGDLLSPVFEEPAPGRPDLHAELADLADLVAESSKQEREDEVLHHSVEAPRPGLVRTVRGEPLPRADSVDEESPLELDDPGGDIAGPEAWEDDDVPTRIEHPEILSEALALLQAGPDIDPLTMGVVDGGAPPSEEDLAADGLSLDLDTESIELLSMDVILDPPLEGRADPAVVEDLVLDLPAGAGIPEDDLSGVPSTAAWLVLDVGLEAPAEMTGPIYLEVSDPGLRDGGPPTLVTLAASPLEEPTEPALALLAEGAELELELELAEVPPLDDRPPEETGDGEDSVDELLIMEEEDTGPESVLLEPDREQAADLLAEGGAIRVELSLGEKAAATREEARRGVAVAPARPLRKWDGKTGDPAERATDLVALARLQETSGSGTREPSVAAEPVVPDAEPGEIEPGGPNDDWLADVGGADAVAADAPVVQKGDPMSPYYEDTLPGWLPGDDAGATRGAPRAETTDISPSASKPKPKRGKKKRR